MYKQHTQGIVHTLTDSLKECGTCICGGEGRGGKVDGERGGARGRERGEGKWEGEGGKGKRKGKRREARYINKYKKCCLLYPRDSVGVMDKALVLRSGLSSC